MHLENGKLSIDVKSFGAELTSIKYNNKEFLWNADKKYWGKHAPILFPIVGRFKDNEALIEGKIYSMGQHGFARDNDFKEVFSGDNKVTYLLTYSDETLKMYPYKFELYISYEIFENKVKVTYEVKNIDDKKMFFSIGGHPAFCWPLVEGEEFNDYYIEFNEKETQKFIKCVEGCLKYEENLIIENTDKIDLDKSKFSIDTFVFKNLNSNKVSLKSKKSSAEVSLYFDGFPYLGIWSKENEAPFICLEPWYGVADFVDHDKNFETKEGILQLNVDEKFECSYVIEVKD